MNIIRVIKSRRMGWEGYVACMKAMRNSYKILVGKLVGNRSRGKPRCTREDNIRMGIREIGRDGVVWIHLAQDRGL
jgi:hypothetical protein